MNKLWLGRKYCLSPVIFGLGLAAILSLSLSTHVGAEPSKRAKVHEEFSNGSPEYLVDALMAFDFKGGIRQNPETYSRWLPLTTNESNDKNYDLCPVGFVIESYRVDKPEAVSPNKVRVPVQVEMLGLIGDWAYYREHGIDKCNWPELSVAIYNSFQGNWDQFKHPMTSPMVIKAITGSDMETDFLANSGNSSKHEKNKLIVVPEGLRTWRFMVEVVKQQGKWLISTRLIPHEHMGLQAAINDAKNGVEFYRMAIRVCAGELPPIGGTFMQHSCPPIGNPKNDLKYYTNRLQVLESFEVRE